MMAGSHVALGAAVWVAVAPHLGLPAIEPLPFAAAVAGSLLPDIDHPKSWVGKHTRPFSNIVAGLFGHRGATHSALALAGCCWLLARHGTLGSIALPFVIGYLSHLAGDLLTPRGLRLAWPFKGNFALPLCRAGSPFEPLIVAAVVAVALCTVLAPSVRHSLVQAAPSCRGASALCPPRLPG